MNTHMDGINATATVHWQAFRDDNFNGHWDKDELALPEVAVNGDTSGVIADLGDGLHALAVIAPTGYAPVQGSHVTVWLNGAELSLPPLAFRFSNVFAGQAFSDEDWDGDGQRGGIERVARWRPIHSDGSRWALHFL